MEEGSEGPRTKPLPPASCLCCLARRHAGATSAPARASRATAAAAGEAPAQFQVVQSKTLSEDVQLASWCPTMDLLALVTADNKIHVHRSLSWQRLVTLQPSSSPLAHQGVATGGGADAEDGRVSALAWHPEGEERRSPPPPLTCARAHTSARRCGVRVC